MHRHGDRDVPADQFERLMPGTRLVEEGGNDRGDVAAGNRATRHRRGREPDPAGGWGVGEAARAQDGPVQGPGAQIILGGGLRRDVGRREETSSDPGLRRLASA